MKLKNFFVFGMTLLCFMIVTDAMSQESFVKDLKITPDEATIQFIDDTSKGYLIEIGGPNSYYWRTQVLEEKEITFKNKREDGGAFADGHYTMQITPLLLFDDETREEMRAISESGDMKAMAAFKAKMNIPETVEFFNYNFHMAEGKFTLTRKEDPMKTPSLTDNKMEELYGTYASLTERHTISSNFTGRAWGDNTLMNEDAQVFVTDVVVQGSLCVGVDCVNGESFGFDTVRLKENNLRIRAMDTSTSASFPTNDWQITFNDSSNGGANKFSIDDIDGGRTPFTIEAGARTNALYVEADGDVGIGTANPAVDVHVVTGNTPTYRLEQDGSNGFTSQTWDLAGNEANFFIRDVTNGGTLPFRIRPSAPESTLELRGNQSVGGANDGQIKLSQYGDGNITGTATQLLAVDVNGNVIEEAIGGGSSVWTDNSGDIYYNGGDVGIGTTTPDRSLEIVNGANPQMRLSHTDGIIYSDIQNDGTDLIFSNTGGTGRFMFSSTAPTVRVNDSGSGLVGFFGNGDNVFTGGGDGNFSVRSQNNLNLGAGGDNLNLEINNMGKVSIKKANGSGVIFQVGTNGDGTTAESNGWNSFSDFRLKRDLQNIDNPLAKLSQLNGYYYYWKKGKQDQSQQVGVVAQEVESVLPEIVMTNKDGIKSVDYSKLSALLIEAVKEQQQTIETQQNEINVLNAELAELKDLKAQVTRLTELVMKQKEGATSSSEEYSKE